MDIGPIDIYRLFATGGEPVGSMMTKMPEMPKPFWAYDFNVKSIDDAIERTIKAVGKVIHGPHKVPGPMFTYRQLPRSTGGLVFDGGTQTLTCPL